mmetsp:Transcript_11371/g.21477  ORF Transcript_11371/g.21477 Transcript_11371/m.21477 type:complete len:303 (+) Transcript_11371:79-987(+)
MSNQVVQGQVVQGNVVGKPAAYAEQPGGPPAVQAQAAYDVDVDGGLGVVQMQCKSPMLPPEIRLGFIKKVYGILAVMLLITFGLCVPFIFMQDATLDFFRANVWILYIIGAIVIAQLCFDCAMSCQMCCGGSSLIRGYLKMMTTPPWNYAYLMTFSVCLGVIVGFTCARYTAESVLIVFALTVVVVVALTIYAVKTSADFTGFSPFILVACIGLVLILVAFLLFPYHPLLTRIAGGICATIFGILIVHDTQMIFGTASFSSFGGGKHTYEYTIDMYAFAAWNLYLDFITFFLYMLQFLGQRE